MQRTNTFAVFLFLLLSSSLGLAQAPENGGSSASSPSDNPVQGHSPDEVKAGSRTDQAPPGGRVLGVLPNYRTVDASNVAGPLTVGQKFTLARKDSFDYPLGLVAASLAGIGQASKQNPSFGQEAGGFGKRYVTTFADQAVANMLTEAVFPSILHQDPRYYRRGTGTVWSRTGYALSRLFVTPTDSGKRQFNYSEWAGNASATALSNFYYPDARTVGANLHNLAIQSGLDGLDLVLKEFWPDIKQKFFAGHQTTNSGH